MGKGMSRSSILQAVHILSVGCLVALGLLGPGGCQKTDDLLDPGVIDDATVLHAVYRSTEEAASNPIVLDGQAIEREWGGGGGGHDYMNVRVSSENGVGEAGPQAFVSLKAVYTDTDIFFLIRWVDNSPDESKDAMFYVGTPLDSLDIVCPPALVDERNWVRNPGNAYDEDRISIAFEVDSAGSDLGPYSEFGCMTACHATETPGFGRLGYGRLDIWQWLAARTNPVRDLYDRRESASNPTHGIPGYLDDLFADAFGGLQADPGSPAYRPNFVEGSDLPLYVYRERDDPFVRPQDPSSCFNEFGENPCRKNNGVSLAYTWREEIEVHVAQFASCDTTNFAPLPLGTEPSKWTTGDQVNGWLLTYPRGDRANVHGKALYELGVWTLEVGRPLNTGNPAYDVIFRPEAGRSYVFTVAVMNNSGTVHLGSEPQRLVFDPKGGRS